MSVVNVLSAARSCCEGNQTFSLQATAQEGLSGLSTWSCWWLLTCSTPGIPGWAELHWQGLHFALQECNEAFSVYLWKKNGTEMQTPQQCVQGGSSSLSSRGGHFQLCHEDISVPGLLCLFEQSYLKLLRQFPLCKLNVGLKSHGHIPGSSRGNKAAQGKPGVTPGAGQVFHVRLEAAQGISSSHSQAQKHYKVTYWDFFFFF